MQPPTPPLRRSIAVVVAAVAVICGACVESTEQLFGPDLYEQSCQRCHGAAGEGGIGDPLGPGSEASTLSDDQIADTIRVGPGTMPGFPQLTDEQVQSLVAHLRSLQDTE